MENVHKKYDVIVIGAGAGGLNIAHGVNSIGLKVLLIDREDRAIGGDCLNHGCIPSKALIHVAQLFRDGKDAGRFGLSLSGQVDIEKVMDYITSKKEIIRTHENATYLREKGIDVALGKVSFINETSVEVEGVIYTAKKVILATGSRPRKLDLKGLEDVETFDNENIFSIKTLPKNMVIIGTGPIGVEIGQAFSAFGTKVTIVGPALLEKEDPEIVSVLSEILLKDGVDLSLGYKPTEVKNGNTLIIQNDKGEMKEIFFDMLFVSIGRVLNVENLALEKADVKQNERGGIIVDNYLQTTNKNVLACGDVAGNYMFTHASELHASVILHNLFSPFKKKLNTDAMAWVTYTYPEIATFGFSEKELIKRGMVYETVVQKFADSDRAIVDEHRFGKVKVYISKNGKLLGGTVIGHNAGEISQELMLLQANGMNIKLLLNKVYPYPTASRVNRTLALLQLKKRLTNTSKTLLQLLFKLM